MPRGDVEVMLLREACRRRRAAHALPDGSVGRGGVVRWSSNRRRPSRPRSNGRPGRPFGHRPGARGRQTSEIGFVPYSGLDRQPARIFHAQRLRPSWVSGSRSHALTIDDPADGAKAPRTPEHWVDERTMAPTASMRTRPIGRAETPNVRWPSLVLSPQYVPSFGVSATKP